MQSQAASDIQNQNLHLNHPEVICMHVKVWEALLYETNDPFAPINIARQGKKKKEQGIYRSEET